jgi:hypothetical protein
MSKGHIFLAQNSDVDYVRQAYALALTIKKHNQNNQTCIVTNNTIPDEYRKVFDHVVEIPWKDSAHESTWKIENRWKIIHATPFKQNLVYDTDMLLLTSNDHWWDYLDHKDISLTSKVYDYKGNIIVNDYYRKTFRENVLPDVYTGVHYFKKNKRSFEFYKFMQIITENWQKIYDSYLLKYKQKFCSMDVNAALTLRFMDAEEDFLDVNSPLSFTHMKPNIQGWTGEKDSWQNVVTAFLNKDSFLNVGNYLQTGIFHYTEDSFLTDQTIKKMEE